MKSFLYGFAVFIISWPILAIMLAMMFLSDDVMKQMPPETRREAAGGILGIALMLAIGLGILLGIVFSRHG